MLATAASMTPSPERLPPHARLLGAGGLPPSPREAIERKERFSERKARDACDSIMMYSEIDRAVGSSSERRAGSPQPTTARAARAAAATDVASQLVKDDSAYALHQGHESELRNMVVDAAAARDAGIPNGTASADEWGFAWCRRFATATSNRWMRPREAASALDQLRENYFFMMALVWITQMIAPSARRRAQGYERGKPTSALLAIYAYARVLRDCGRHVPNLHDARSVLQGLCMRYKNVWGDEALVPEHKKPYSRAHIVRMVQLLASVAVVGWSGTLHAAMLAAVCYSIATGVRKDEWTLSFVGDTYVRRSNFHWVDEITGNDLPDVPATWQSRRNGHLLRGRCAASKCDRLNIEWGGKDMWFRYDDSNPFNFAWRWCEWELAHPCPQGARQRWPAFSPSGDGTPFKAAQADALLRTLLMLAMSSADAMCRTWHSFRVTIATIIVNSQDIARDEVEGIAQALVRWKTPESVRLYGKMQPHQYADYVDMVTRGDAHGAAISGDELPETDPEQAVRDHQATLAYLDHEQSAKAKSKRQPVADDKQAATRKRKPQPQSGEPPAAAVALRPCFNLGDGASAQDVGDESWGAVGERIRLHYSFWGSRDADDEDYIACTVAGYIGRHTFPQGAVSTHTYVIECHGHHYAIRHRAVASALTRAAARARARSSGAPRLTKAL